MLVEEAGEAVLDWTLVHLAEEAGEAEEAEDCLKRETRKTTKIHLL